LRTTFPISGRQRGLTKRFAKRGSRRERLRYWNKSVWVYREKTRGRAKAGTGGRGGPPGRGKTARGGGPARLVGTVSHFKLKGRVCTVRGRGDTGGRAGWRFFPGGEKRGRAGGGGLGRFFLARENRSDLEVGAKWGGRREGRQGRGGGAPGGSPQTGGDRRPGPRPADFQGDPAVGGGEGGGPPRKNGQRAEGGGARPGRG